MPLKNLIVNRPYRECGKEIRHFLDRFDAEGEAVYRGKRNTIKRGEIDGYAVNVKAFRVPHLANRIVYRYFRKSKAARSFHHARKLLDCGIGTPEPIAYLEELSLIGLKKSFYVCKHLDYDITYRELIHGTPLVPDTEPVLRAFTRFTFQLHENDIQFLDHSPGNTLMQINDGDYRFFLVDLNRMRFRKLGLKDRIANFARITPKKEMVEVMSDEYAKLSGASYEEVFELMWGCVSAFQKRFQRKKRLKRKLGF